ncbi:MAG: hypothetical protein ACYC8W_07655 [Candidatus Tyrphobacter sp.]
MTPNVHQRLIEARDAIVLCEDYGKIPPVRETWVRHTVPSPFPGGTGFYAGNPSERRIMFVGNNYDGENNLKHPPRDDSAFHLTLLAYMGDDADKAFVTNYYMGAKPKAANGSILPFATDAFAVKCRLFFDKQIEIIDPVLVVAMGDEAKVGLEGWCARPVIFVPHPSSKRTQQQRDKYSPPIAHRIASALEKLT